MKGIRHREGAVAAAALGAAFRGFDLGDYPLVMDAAAVERLTDLICELEPQRDPDARGARSVQPRPCRRVRSDRAGAPARERRGCRERLCDDPSARALLFEPHQPELCGFVPTTFLDITPVWELKVAAMDAMGAQGYLRQYYSERAEHRANHARRISGRGDIRYAEAFQREIPVVVDAL